MPVRVFISYSRSDDEAFVRRLYESLKAAGFDVWFDRVSMPSRELTFSKESRTRSGRRFTRLLFLAQSPGHSVLEATQT
jgi:hypothetical protein